MKKITALLGFCLFTAFGAYGQVNYPNPTGHVNDFANIIDSSTENELENKLHDYREQTSIEIAVATVNSLEGVTVDGYAVGLFNKWGIGDADKNNGILVLVAPNEREMKIEVGYGMEPDLTDAQAGRIIENYMISYFKAGQMETGIVAGVNAVISQLGTTPFEARLEERKLVEEKRQAEEKRRAEKSAAAMRFAGVVLAFVLVIGTPIVLVFVRIKRRIALERQYGENTRTLDECLMLINKAEAGIPDVKRKLEELKSITPKEVWGSFERTVADTPEAIKSARKGLGDLEGLNNKNGLQKSRETFSAISALLQTAAVMAGLSETVRVTILNVQNSKDKSPKLLENILKDIKAFKEAKTLEHKDVSEKAKIYLQEAEQKCDEARGLMAESGLLNWLMIYAVVIGAATLVEKAKKKAISDKDEAEEARRPKPVYRSSPSFTSSRPRSGGNFGGGGRSGGFGGFGGGRSGGGGARGKW